VLSTEVNNPKKTFCVVALADEEGLISVWSSSKTSPLLVIRDCFEDAVTDITWDKDGTGIMLASSLDGTITIVKDFLEGSSAPLKETELDRHLQALYGKSAKDINKQQTPVKQNSLALQYSKINMVKSANTIPNNHTNNVNQGHSNNVSSSVSVNISTSKASSIPVKQIISLNKDGKKRITPVQIYNPNNSSSTTYENGASSYTQSSPPSPSNNLGSSRPRTDLNVPQNPGTSQPRNDLNAAKKPKLSHDIIAPGLKVSLLRNEIIVTLPSYPKNHTIEFIVQNKNNSKSDKNISVANIFKDKVHVLRAVSLASPKELLSIANIGYQTSCLTSISLFESPIENNNNTNNSKSGSVNSPLWRCAVTGQATCISGIQHSNSSSNEEIEGVCVIGCSDGTLHLLNLSSGLRLLPPLVVGMAIANIDMVVINANIHILVLTVDGSLCGWSLNIGTSELSCIFSADVKPVIYSVKSRITFGDYPKISEPTAAPENLIHAFIEKCYFFPSPSKILPTVHVRSGKGGVGVGVGTDGSLQVFTYNYTTKTWMRTADSRHVLSSASSGPANYPLTELDKLQKDSNQSSGIAPSAVTSLSTIMNRPQFR
jgi:hypothetical protein